VRDRDTVFGTWSTRGFSNWDGAKKKLDAQLGFSAPWILHNIRQTVETRMAGLGIPKEHVNKVLNHAAGPVTQRYDGHDYMAEEAGIEIAILPLKAAALQRWADELDRIVGA